ncbi:hypothetical protein, variant [Sphaeroforma arctica JP610]|nr:hypothetical protein, variant [Sphaeroforma arctica JP610]KNC84787.1 hypothetical protein, variant [Sphaeroforma arctica JP610]|eukprot:XP_014158690.1 hypothetical protein, variant [Sphaeroforma arctica JP610]
MTKSMTNADTHTQRVAILGAGPIGIECASALQRSLPNISEIIILEAGDTIASNIRQNWPHVRLFSPWKYNTSTSSREVLRSDGQDAEGYDGDKCVTGGEYIDQYLEPVAKALVKCDNVQLHLRTRVVSVGRSGLLKRDMGKEARSKGKFNILCTRIPLGGKKESVGDEFCFRDVDAVLDCTGTRSDYSWFGEGGMPAIGEKQLSRDKDSGSFFTRLIPQVGEVKGKRVAVIGSGYSAATSVRNLIDSPTVQQIYWLTRRVLGKSGQLYRVLEGDALQNRAALCEMANELVSRNPEPEGDGSGMENKVAHIDNCTITYATLNESTNGSTPTITLTIDATDPTAERLPVHKLDVDYLVSNVGMRPDLSIHSELQVHTCYATEGPMALAATLLGASGDCLTQATPGIDSLLTPEPNFFVLGNKSYGRSSAFLMRVGIEQAEAVALYLREQI